MNRDSKTYRNFLKTRIKFWKKKLNLINKQVNDIKIDDCKNTSKVKKLK